MLDLQECGGSVYELFQQMLNSDRDAWKSVGQVLVDYSQEKILQSHYATVGLCWRRLLIDAGLVRALGQLDQGERWCEVLWALDTCHVVSGSPGRYRETLALLQELQAHMSPKQRGGRLGQRSAGGSVRFPVPRLAQAPSLAEFMKRTGQPFIFPAEAWPAFTQWDSVDYLLQVASDRMVPVELGKSYTDPGWRQELMRFETFVDRCLLGDEMGYLAQHDLLSQVPRLENDYWIPEYCYLPLALDTHYPQRPEEVIKNAWLGPAGTVSPLHHDPFHNLLVQVVGSKYIRLYHPNQNLYPHQGIMNNTSQVDIENPNLQEFPEFEQTQYVDCILQKGDILYIPPTWWHFVKSLDTSFNVSLWF